MSIKLIAVDMDGTFLNDEKSYDKSRFLEQYTRLKQRGIHFVVASGNQYYQLVHYFPEIHKEIGFVAENGAYVVDAGEEIHCGQFSKAEIARILAVLADVPDIQLVVCGKNSAYAHDSMPHAVVEKMSNHYRRLKKVADFTDVEDIIFKFSLGVKNEAIPALLQKLSIEVGDISQPVGSGFGFIDLIIPGLHKANGISLLQARWGVKDSEVVAIGDSDNDIEMLRHAGFGFAMANASPTVKEVAGYFTESNNCQGALNVISRVLEQQTPF
ncbi:Cof-type HAD-IIB family hydrolase [Serratia sp. M24T3]|uniref:Cof-type HAD-IIB family hydrolase n=1 Tax=Serratia sp. M24T3 TaxID=932213 RepID=UPI00025BAF3F|nr:Cof-type HAD-IIB family hydrolase [Serratia sp. M24T3]EIC85330.1 Cof-like hydrolase [Serratia sp. M24T3]